MLRKLHEARDEEGFTLIELLVVVIIIGILAAIAIPAFLNQRESAWVSSAESDARNAAIQVETEYTSNDAYPADGTDLTTLGVETSTGVTLDYTLAADGNSYTIEACHDQVEASCAVPFANATATYDSAAGGLQ